MGLLLKQRQQCFPSRDVACAMVNLSPKLDWIWNHNEGTPPDVSIRVNPGRLNGREDLP